MNVPLGLSDSMSLSSSWKVLGNCGAADTERGFHAIRRLAARHRPRPSPPTLYSSPGGGGGGALMRGPLEEQPGAGAKVRGSMGEFVRTDGSSIPSAVRRIGAERHPLFFWGQISIIALPSLGCGASATPSRNVDAPRSDCVDWIPFSCWQPGESSRLIATDPCHRVRPGFHRVTALP